MIAFCFIYPGTQLDRLKSHSGMQIGYVAMTLFKPFLAARKSPTDNNLGSKYYAQFYIII